MTGSSAAYGLPEIQRRINGTLRQGRRDGGFDLRFRALGTDCRIFWESTSAQADTLAAGVVGWVAAFEAKYSRFWPESLISQINRAAGADWVPIDPETERILALCNELHFLSRGAFDPTALPLLQLWDWKHPRTHLPSDEEVAAARALVGWNRVQRRPGQVRLPEARMGLDLGGMGKEYAVDQATQWMIENGATSALVDFGADVRVSGPPPNGRPAWHIGLEDPKRPGSVWVGLALREGAVATSGDYHRKFELAGIRYSHIVDLKRGRPAAQGVRAVSILAPSCTQAGLLSTTMFTLPPVEAIRLLEQTAGAAGAIVTDHQTLISRRFYEYIAS